MLAASDLLEREGELAQLGALIEAARDGAGRFVLLEGGAGIGKTGLLTAAREWGREAGMDVLHARGGELEREFSYGIVRQLFEPALAGARGRSRAEILSGAAALAAPLFGGDYLADGGSTAAESGFATVHGLFWLTANLAGRRPLMLAVDDLHWADKPSLRWLSYLIRRLEGLPLLSLPLGVWLVRFVSQTEGRPLNQGLKRTGQLHLLFGVLFALALWLG